MQSTNLPSKYLVPFAKNDGAKVELPVTTATAGRASQSLGFPPITGQPPEAGGLPPQLEDFNGAMNQPARIAWWSQLGGKFPFDGTFATDSNINGYPLGAELAASDNAGTWLSLADNNVANPDTTGTGWVPGRAYGAFALTAQTGGTVTPTPVQAMKRRIAVAGALTSNLIVILPNWLYSWDVTNNTSGAFSVTVKTAAGAGVVVPQNGAPTTVLGDGTNIAQPLENQLVVTVPQFDNTQRAVSTSFLAQAGLQFSPLHSGQATSAATPMDASYVGGRIVFNNTINQTATLPATAGLPNGAAIWTSKAASATTANVAISAASGTAIIDTGGGLAASVVLNGGEDCCFVWNQVLGLWVCSGTFAYRYNNFTLQQSLAGNGYQRLSGSMYLQWGSASVTTSTSTITLPKPASAAVLTIQATPSDSVATDAVAVAQLTGSLTTFGLRSNKAAGVACTWFAITI